MRLASSLGKDAMVRDAVKDVQEGLGESQEIAEAVEAEVDQLPGQFDHLEGEFVLLGVAKGPDVVNVTSNTHCMLTISFTITGRSSAGGSPAS